MTIGSVDDDLLIAALRAKVAKPNDPKVAAIASERRLPATPEIVLAAEKKLGRALHPLLRRAYLEVTNGGFGPGYGALSLSGADSLPTTFERLVDDDRWPTDLLPVWDWGCAIWSCVDSAARIVTHDGVKEPMLTEFDVRAWLQLWTEGVDLWAEMFVEREVEITNPFTRKPMKTKVTNQVKGRPWTPPVTKI